MPDLITDIMGHVERLPLRPSSENALLPMYEAVSNSLHAIQDRFGDEEASTKGRIEIDVIRADTDEENPRIVGFRISDNGVGFNEDNYLSFRTPFTRAKIQRGGKGIGRLGWLKVFESISVHSTYENGKDIEHRAFNFVLRDREQLEETGYESCPTDGPGSIVYLKDFMGAFGSKCPAKTNTLVQRIISHFLPVFTSDKPPRIHLIDSITVDLKSEFDGMTRDQKEELVEIVLDDQIEPIIIKHMRCDKRIRPRGNNNHWLVFSANDRGVKEYAIDEQLGLGLLNDDEIYVGAVTGDFLDATVNTQRTDFTISEDESKEIRRRVADRVRDYLGIFIEEALSEKKRVTRTLIQRYPQYLYVSDTLDEFVKDLKPNSTGEEAIYLEMSQKHFRRQKHFVGVERDIQSAVDHSEAIAEKVDEYQKYIVDDQKGALATYVVRRKAILDLLEKLKGFDEQSDEKHHLEDAVHELICPMRVDSLQLQIEDHNLWILDDRLAFFNFFASDKQIRTYMDGDSSERPDIAFFYDACVAWREHDRSADSVVLVEFKRPGRDDYTPEANPLRQTINYINLLRSAQTVRDLGGGVISGVSERTAFQCYIIADITQKLEQQLYGFPLSRTPDGRGMFGYIDNPRAFVEIIPYEKLLSDAQQRNAIFFSKLGMNT